jgi:phytoene dehydrogenase-like protein
VGATPDPAQVLIVGAGHNGLVAACYLARAGADVTVVERGDVIGGATVTEELIPGFRVSTASYSLSLLRPDIVRDLGLRLEIHPKDPQLFVPLPDGRSFFVWRDAARTREELTKISVHDADAYARWSSFWERAVAALRPLVETPDPPPLSGVEGIVGRDIFAIAVKGSAADAVSRWFEDPAIRGVFASQGIIGTFRSVYDHGTAWVMAYHAVGGELVGASGTWAYVRGGMGAVSGALASAAAALGVTIRTSSPVASIEIDDGRAAGARLDDGSMLTADVVVSNADPVRTFLGLVPDGALDASFAARVRGWDTAGCVVKVNMALAELPDFVALPGAGPQQRGTVEISPSLDYLDAAYRDAAAGRVSREPFVEVFVGSAVDDSLAPPGQHVLSAFAQYAPARGWEPEEALESVLGVLCDRAPNVRDAVLACEVLGPPELEERFALTGGNIFHGEITPEQCFGERFDYRTPVPGLYLCGSGARPGGGVMGAAGRNCARAVLADLSRELP